MKKSIYWAGIIIAAAVVIAAILIGQVKKVPAGEALAWVNEETITVDEFKKEWRRNISAPEGFPPDSMEKLLNDMIVEKLFLKEARRRGMEKDPRFEEEAENYREQLLVEALLNMEVLSVPRPPQPAIEEYWKEHRADFAVPRLIRISHIVIKANEGEGDDEAEERIQAVSGRLEKGEDFSRLASEVSEDNSSFRGGDLGYFPPGRLAPELEGGAWELEVGEISGPIKTRYGYHIIKVTDKKEPRDKTLEEARREVIAKILAEKRKNRFAALETELRAGSTVQIDQEALNRLQMELGRRP